MQATTNSPTQDGEISIREALAILGEQKFFIFLFCISAILTALALTFIASDKYNSATTIVYRPEDVTRLKPQETQAFGAPTPHAPFELIAQNLSELVKSETLLRAVVVELNLDKKIEAPDSPIWYIQLYRDTKSTLMALADDVWMYLKYGRVIEEDPISAATRGLRENVTLVDNASYVFYLVVRDKYPLRAPMIVDAIAARLVSYLHEEQRLTGTEKLAQLKSLLDEKTLEIESYERQIEDTMVANNIVSSSVEAEHLVKQWSSLETSRILLDGEIEQAQRRLQDSTTYYSNKQKSLQEGGSDSSNLNFIQPADFKKLASDRLFTEIELNGLQAKRATLVASIKALDRRRSTLPGIGTQLDYLESRLAAAKRDFAQFSDAYQEATVRATGAFSEAKILHPAIIPSFPIAPIKIYNVGLAAFLSIFIATALVYLLSYAELQLLFPIRKRSREEPSNLATTELPATPAAQTAATEAGRRNRERRTTNVVPWLQAERRQSQDRRDG